MVLRIDLGRAFEQLRHSCFEDLEEEFSGQRRRTRNWRSDYHFPRHLRVNDALATQQFSIDSLLDRDNW